MGGLIGAHRGGEGRRGAGVRNAAAKTATIRDVAREANVSVASASRALNGMSNVTGDTRERVLTAARELRYVPHTGARSLITRKTDTIGLVLPDLHGEFFSEVIRGVDQAAWGRGLHLLVSNSHGAPEEAARAIRAMRGRADGLLIMSPHVDSELLAENLPDDLPTVLMNTPIRAGGRPVFGVDNQGGAAAVTRHLLECGFRRIVHIAGPAANFEASERRRGYLETLAGAAEPRLLDGDFSEESGYAAGRRLAADEPPDAVFAANDMMAVGCLRALQDAGLRTPQDVAVAGFDDIPIARLIRLTTVRTDISDLGRRALERLAAVIAGSTLGEPIEISRPELVVRESTAGRPAANTQGEQA